MLTKSDSPNKPDCAEGSDLQRVCVFLRKPSADCYCMNLSSFNIRKMLAFCTGDYRSCPIYREKAAKAREEGTL